MAIHPYNMESIPWNQFPTYNQMKSGMKTDRQLVYIPIIHTETDMGGLGKTLSKVALREFGEESRLKKQDVTNRMWENIEKAVQNLNLTFSKVRLYQDGLPECGREADIVRDLAAGGSRNHQLLIRLMEKGASLVGTESPALLVQEYEIIRQMMQARDGPDDREAFSRLKAMGERILKERDLYIARRINATLEHGETGILFLGMLHNLEGMLDEEIMVSYPLYRPPVSG